jgi:hypothetical protein
MNETIAYTFGYTDMPPKLTDSEIEDLKAQNVYLTAVEKRLRADLVASQKRIEDAEARETFLMTEIDHARATLNKALEAIK